MTASALAAISATRKVRGGENHRRTFPIEVNAFDNRLGRFFGRLIFFDSQNLFRQTIWTEAILFRPGDRTYVWKAFAPAVFLRRLGAATE
jgi:hypothetical protein